MLSTLRVRSIMIDCHSILKSAPHGLDWEERAGDTQLNACISDLRPVFDERKGIFLDMRSGHPWTMTILNENDNIIRRNQMTVTMDEMMLSRSKEKGLYQYHSNAMIDDK